MEECIDASKVGHQVFGDVNDMKDYIVAPKEYLVCGLKMGVP